jgi:hypothetical protein
MFLQCQAIKGAFNTEKQQKQEYLHKFLLFSVKTQQKCVYLLNIDTKRKDHVSICLRAAHKDKDFLILSNTPNRFDHLC